MVYRYVFQYALYFTTLSSIWKCALAASISLPSYPLAVKSPYLSAWLPGNQASHAPTAQAQFWTGTANLTWTVLARINGVTYTLFGAPQGILNTTAATQTSSVSYSSSHTFFHLTAGGIPFTLDFFTPVLPDSGNYARQSLPYSYLTVSAQPHYPDWATSVEILSAIDQSWTAQNGSAAVNYTQTGSSSFFWFYNDNAIPFTELNDMATWGSVIFATRYSNVTRYGCGTADVVYSNFVSNGTLPSPVYAKCANTDLVALASTLSSRRGGNQATFVVGFDRVEAISYLNTTTYTGYYRSQWSTVTSAVAYVIQSYSYFNLVSQVFDSQVRWRAQSVSGSFGSAYADIVEASVRQVFAALEITIPLASMSTEAPYAFIKEISSDGNVNTIDIIYPTFPIFISLNPAYIKLLLRPILDYLNLPFDEGWPRPFVIHDIGAHYPNASGHNDAIEEDMPLFETAALLQLLTAYQKYSGDTSFASTYLSRLELYASYLVNNSLYPGWQIMSIDAITATTNQTGLAIHSTIALKAAASLLGNSTLSTIASANVNQIYNLGLGLDGASPSNSTHFTWNYGQASSWGTVFYAYVDILLGLNTFPAEAWDMQTNWYLSQNQAAGLPFFGPYNFTSNLTSGGCDWTITDWSFWAAAASTSSTFQANVVSATHAFLTDGVNTEPFGTKYYVIGPDTPGVWSANRARSTVGSNFAFVALKQGTWPALYSRTGW